jgi:hypothetical protein
MKIGFDFDNTIINYENVFALLAKEIDFHENEKFKMTKVGIRDYLRSCNKEEIWTRMQAEAYGPKIIYAKPYQDAIETIKKLNKKNIDLCIVSHKTLNPYSGPPYNLHTYAKTWLEQYKFYSDDLFGSDKSNIFFEEDKELKIKRILSCGCTHYIDDLPEILELLPNSVEKILFSPEASNNKFPDTFKVMKNWKDLCQTISKE